MAAHPAQLLVLYLLGFSAFCVLAAALYLLYRAARPRTVLVSDGDGGYRTERVESGSSRLVAPRGRKHALAVLIPLLMLLWVFLGRLLVAPFFPSTSDRVPDIAVTRSSTVQGASGAQLAVTEYGPSQGPALVFTHGWGADQREWKWLLQSLPAGTRAVTGTCRAWAVRRNRAASTRWRAWRAT